MRNLPDVYDLNLLSFVIDEPVEEIELRFAGRRDLFDSVKEAVLNELSDYENVLDTAPEANRSFHRISWLASFQKNFEKSVPLHYRYVCGGQLKFPETDDPFEKLFLYYAGLAYPLYLQRNKDDRRDYFPVLVSWDHPEVKLLFEQIESHEIFSKLYPSIFDRSGRCGGTYRSSGISCTVQLYSLPSDIGHAAWQSLILEDPYPAFDKYAKAVLTMLRTVQSAIEGKPATISTWVGLSGVLLPEERMEIDLLGGRLYPASDNHRNFVESESLKGTLEHTDEDGDRVVVDYAGNLVLRLEIPYKIEVRKARKDHFVDPENWPPNIFDAALFEEPVESLRLALVLSGISERSTVALAWRVTIDPLHHGAITGYGRPQTSIMPIPARLNSEQLADWVTWSNRIHDGRTKGLSVGIRRFLRAVSEVKTTEDTLIDAVIVWENLFGANQETTLRVTHSVAWVLGGDGDDRARLAAECRDIYTHRSNIVHGNANIKRDKTDGYAAKAVDISTQLLRAIFDSRRELLALKSGADRSVAVMLDAPRPT